LWRKTNIILPWPVAWLITFNFVNFAWIIGAFLFILLFKNTNSIRDNFKPGIKHLIILLIIAMAGLLNLYRMNEFIYFGF